MERLQSRWFKDVLFVPPHLGLFDADGQRIDASLHLIDGRPHRFVPAGIDVPRDLERVDEPVVYGGHLPKHFGHFLLESLARTWAYPHLDLGALPFVHFRSRFHLHERELLEGALRRHGAPLLPLTRPTILSSVLIPDQGMELGRDYSPEMRAVYDAIREDLIGPDVAPDGVPIYLSRTHLQHDRHATLGEVALEARLAARGIRVVHPQELPLAEQIGAVARARDVIGFDGSAMHLTIFRSLDDARTIALNTRLVEINQLRVDRLRGAKNIHIRAQFPLHPRFPGLFGGKEWKLGPYRSFTAPRAVERAVLRALAN